MEKKLEDGISIEAEATPPSPCRKMLRACPMCKGKGYFEQAYSPNNSVAGTEGSGLSSPADPNLFRLLPNISGGDSQNGGVTSLPKIKTSPRATSERPRCNSVRRLVQGGSLPQILPSKVPIDTLITDSGSADGKLTSGHANRFKLPPIYGLRSAIFSVAGSRSQSNCSEVGELLPPPQRIDNIQDTIQRARTRLRSGNWDAVISAFEDIVQVCRQDPSAIINHIGEIHRRLVDSLRAPRTKVVRIAEQTARELFQHVRCITRPDFDEIVNILLNKTADSIKAIRVDAAEALDSMVAHMPAQFAVRAITVRAPNHKNPLVRSSVGRLLLAITKSVSPKVLLGQTVYKPTRKQLMETACTFINDPNKEVRGLAKSIFIDLIQELEFDDVFYAEVDCKLIRRTDRMLIMLRYANEIKKIK